VAQPPSRAPFDPERTIAALSHHGVAFVVIGGIAGRAHGSPTVTGDLDVCYARTRANMAALAAALRDLHARLAGVDPRLPFVLDARTIELGDRFTFETDAGGFDVLGAPDGTSGYDDLAANAVEVEAWGHRFQVASLDDLIRMKRASGRAKDRIELEVLGALREEIAASRAEGTKDPAP
jgi:hypothetical protein